MFRSWFVEKEMKDSHEINRQLNILDPSWTKYVSLSFSFSLYIYVCLSFCLFVCLSVFWTPIRLSVCLSVDLPPFVPLCLFVSGLFVSCLFVLSFICLSVYMLYVCLSICYMPVCLYVICLSICFYVGLYVYALTMSALVFSKYKNFKMKLFIRLKILVSF